MSQVPPPPPPQNPYEPPGEPGRPMGDTTEYARSKVSAPAMLIMVYTGLESLVMLAFIAFNLLGMGMGMMGEGIPVQQGPGGPVVVQQPGMAVWGVGVGVTLVVMLVALALYGATFLGAFKMRKLESYGWAMAASILAMLPCSYCCPLGLGLGIWSLIVLNDPAVKQSFR